MPAMSLRLSDGASLRTGTSLCQAAWCRMRFFLPVRGQQYTGNQYLTRLVCLTRASLPILRIWISATGQGWLATETCTIRMLRCITLEAPQAAQGIMPSRWSCRRETACICSERTCPHGRWCLTCHLSRQELS